MSGSEIAKQEMNRSNLLKDVVEEVSGESLFAGHKKYTILKLIN